MGTKFQQGSTHKVSTPSGGTKDRQTATPQRPGQQQTIRSGGDKEKTRTPQKAPGRGL